MDKPKRPKITIGPLRDKKAERDAMFAQWRKEALEEG